MSVVHVFTALCSGKVCRRSSRFSPCMAIAIEWMIPSIVKPSPTRQIPLANPSVMVRHKISFHPVSPFATALYGGKVCWRSSCFAYRSTILIVWIIPSSVKPSPTRQMLNGEHAHTGIPRYPIISGLISARSPASNCIDQSPYPYDADKNPEYQTTNGIPNTCTVYGAVVPGIFREVDDLNLVRL